MRARAQKRKKASDEVGETSPTRQTAAEARADVAAEPELEVAAERPVPDPQQPPVVAPVLMPAVALEMREDVSAAAVAAAEAERAAITPVVEALMSVTAAPQPSSAQQRDAQPVEFEADTRTPVAPPPREDGSVDGDDADATWRAHDEARLLVQSPRRLFLYWRFARDPRELLRAALGPIAERLRQAVRLVDVASGEEGEPAPAEGGDSWFDVLPGRLLRADVGFHGEGLPFVRLISSNTVETPAVGVSRVEDEAAEFRVAEQEFGRVLEATGFAADERRDEPDRRDAPNGTDDPVRPRASSDTARPTSSPRDGGHFSNTRGGELF